MWTPNLIWWNKNELNLQQKQQKKRIYNNLAQG